MRMTSTRRSGFTLGEVLVTIAIIAVLAAVVLPSIGGQLNKGDIGRVSNDLTAVRSAVEQYLADVRRYPNSVGQLTNRPGAGGVILGNAQTLSAAEVARWRGPYLTKDSTAADSTGFGLRFGTSSAGLFDTLTVATSGAGRAAGTKYVTVTMLGLDSATAQTVDAAMDDGNRLTGALRWRVGSTPGTNDTLRFFALPYQ